MNRILFGKICFWFAMFMCVFFGIKKSYAGDDQVYIKGFNRSIDVVEDKKRDVTCYVFDSYQRGGISCIPNDQINKKQKESRKNINEDVPQI